MLTIQLVFFSLFLGCSKDTYCTSELCIAGIIPNEISEWIYTIENYDYGTCFNFNGGYKMEITNLEGKYQIYSMNNDTFDLFIDEFDINDKTITYNNITEDIIFRSYQFRNRFLEIIVYIIIIVLCIGCLYIIVMAIFWYMFVNLVTKEFC